MATKKVKKGQSAAKKPTVAVKKAVTTKKAPVAVMPEWLKAETVAAKPAEVKSGSMAEEGALDPAEEKMLDWILKGVVGFILAWLGLSVILVVGGLFHLWK